MQIFNTGDLPCYPKGDFPTTSYRIPSITQKRNFVYPIGKGENIRMVLGLSTPLVEKDEDLTKWVTGVIESELSLIEEVINHYKKFEYVPWSRLSPNAPQGL